MLIHHPKERASGAELRKKAPMMKVCGAVEDVVYARTDQVVCALLRFFTGLGNLKVRRPSEEHFPFPVFLY